MLSLAAATLLVAIMVAFANWRLGVFAMIAVAVLQDPLRKLVPGQPAWFVLGAAMVFAVLAFAAWTRGAVITLRPLYLGDRGLRTAWHLMIFIVVVQVFHAFVRWGSPALPVLGILVYFGPVVAILVGVAFAESERAVRRFMFGYVLIVAPACLTVYLSLDYSDAWPVLRDIGSFTGAQLVIYDVGTVLESNPGTFRAGEIAAWHAATAAIFLIILAARDRSVAFRIVAGLLVIALVGAIILTGRRKMLMALTIFLVTQWGLLAIYRRGAGRLTITILILGILGSFGWTLLDPASEPSLYVQRGLTVFEEAGERVGTALQLLQSAIYRTAGLGFGAGVTAQGAQHVGGAVSAAGGASEAGLGKLIIELGIPGALVAMLLLVLTMLRLIGGFRLLGQADERFLYYAASFAAFLTANAATFAVATQVYGDLFVLIMLGLVTGMLFAVFMGGISVYRSKLAHYRTTLVAALPGRKHV